MQERVPNDTLLVYHTLHIPRQTSDQGMWEADAYLAQHVAQLNAAGRHVAQSLHYHVIDIEAMASQMSKDTLLIDNTHPGPDFMMQVGFLRHALSMSSVLVGNIHPMCEPTVSALQMMNIKTLEPEVREHHAHRQHPPWARLHNAGEGSASPCTHKGYPHRPTSSAFK